MKISPLYLHQINDDSLPCWPVTWGVPLNQGELTDTAQVSLEDESGSLLPTQARALTRYDDGSIRRLLVTSEPAIPGVGRQSLALNLDQAGPEAEQGAAVGEDLLAGAAGDISISKNSIVFDTPHGRFDSFMTAGGHLDDRLGWHIDGFEPFESGPICAGVCVRSTFHREEKEILQVRLTLRVFRSTPVVLCDVLALNLSDNEFIELDELRLHLRRQEGNWRAADYEIRQRPSIARSALPLEVRAEKLKLSIINPEGTQESAGRLLNFNETWLAASGDSSRTVVALRNFYEYFPFGVRIEPSEMVVDFWPSWNKKPWSLKQGAGKTHEIAFAFLPEDDSEWSSRAIGYAVGKPPLARTPVEVYQLGGVFEELLDYEPERYPRVETTLFDIAFNRNKGYGKMNWGDDYSALYTNQLRGKGHIVWNNLEGDHPFHMWRQFIRTGLWQHYKDYHDSILHWADVDFCDRSSKESDEGALRVHSAAHWTAGTTPSHNWAEGFREWYFATGDPRPLEILEKMADWIVKQAEQGQFEAEPEPYVRSCGWGLIQMAAIQETLERDEIRGIMLKLCGDLLDYCREHDGLTMTMPTGGSWLPKDNAFHTATVVIGAYRTWQLYGEQVAHDLAITASEAFMDERTCTPEGIAVYITGPEQAFPMQQAAGFAMGGLACAYYLTGDERYVKRGMRMLEYCLDRGMIVDHMRIPGEFLQIGDDVILNVTMLMPNTQLLSYQMRGMLLFLKAAHKTGMLKEVDYRF